MNNSKLFGLDSFEVTSQKLKDYISETIGRSFGEHILQMDSFLKFPTIGDENSIYIDTTLEEIYRWDSTNLKYYVVGSNYHNIAVIDGRGKEFY